MTMSSELVPLGTVDGACPPRSSVAAPLQIQRRARWPFVVFSVLTLALAVAIVVLAVRQPSNSRTPATNIPAIAVLPADDHLITRIAFGSCAQQSYPQPYWDTVAALRPDVLMLTGDNVYGDCSSMDCTELAAAYAELVSSSVEHRGL